MVECYSPFDKTMLYYGNHTTPGAHFPFNFMFIGMFNQQSDAEMVHSMIKQWLQSMPKGMWPNWVVSMEYYNNSNNSNYININYTNNNKLRWLNPPSWSVSYSWVTTTTREWPPGPIRCWSMDYTWFKCCCRARRSLITATNLVWSTRTCVGTKPWTRPVWTWARTDSRSSAEIQCERLSRGTARTTQVGIKSNLRFVRVYDLQYCILKNNIMYLVRWKIIEIGFSNSSSLWLPLNSDYWRKNMEDELKFKSNLRTYRQLAQLRESPTFIKGDLHLYTLSQWVFGFSRYVVHLRWNHGVMYNRQLSVVQFYF